MDRSRFLIEQSEVESIAQKSGLTVLHLLPSLAKSALNLARPPISKYHVGAAGFGSSGRIFIGVNLEFPGLPLHHSVHAEQFLITNMSIHGEPQINYLTVSSALCGHCRQFLQEIRNAPDIKILITSTENHRKESESEPDYNPLEQLLPCRFGPNDLLDKKVPLLLEPHNNGLFLLSDTNTHMANGNCNPNNELKYAALEAANKSHAPYSECPSGVALVDCDGKIYIGSYMESAAYNPSLGPVQAALVAYVVGGGGAYDRIVGAVLVEKEDAIVRQEHTVKLLLQLISTGCKFVVVHCGLV